MSRSTIHDAMDRINNPESYFDRYLWNPLTRGLIDCEGMQEPLGEMESLGFHEALDHVTACVESGFLHRDRWPEQLFASKAVFDEFIDELNGYDECFRLTDRWWTALAVLAGHVDEEGFIYTSDIADVLLNAFAEANERHPQWKPKRAAKKPVAAKKAPPTKKAAKAKR